jgi:hypothetical protein
MKGHPTQLLRVLGRAWAEMERMWTLTGLENPLPPGDLLLWRLGAARMRTSRMTIKLKNSSAPGNLQNLTSDPLSLSRQRMKVNLRSLTPMSPRGAVAGS